MSSDLRIHIVKILSLVLIVGLAVLAVKLSYVLLLIFGAVLVAAVILTLVDLFRRVLPVGHGVAVAFVLVVLATGLGLLMWMFGSQVGAELATLFTILPGAMENAQEWLEDTTVGGLVQDQLDSLRDNIRSVMGMAGALAMTFTSGMIELFLVVVGGIYLAAQPKLYRGGLLKLVPPSARRQAADALDASGSSLRLWLGGQLVAMAAIGVLTGIGLWLLGVPAPFALALIAFLLDFVPIIGPVVAAIPGILLGFTVSPQVGLATLALYIVLQQIESNVLQPLIQQRAVHLPPALLLFAIFAFGALYGLPGMLLAAPLTVFLYVLVKKLYVRELLDTETPVPGEDAKDEG